MTPIRRAALATVAILLVAVLLPFGCELEDDEKTPRDFGVIVHVTSGGSPLPGVRVDFVAQKDGGKKLSGDCLTNQDGACCWAFGFTLSEGEYFWVDAVARYALRDHTAFATSKSFHAPAGGDYFNPYVDYCGLGFMGRAVAVMYITVED